MSGESQRGSEGSHTGGASVWGVRHPGCPGAQGDAVVVVLRGSVRRVGLRVCFLVAGLVKGIVSLVRWVVDVVVGVVGMVVDVVVGVVGMVVAVVDALVVISGASDVSGPIVVVLDGWVVVLVVEDLDGRGCFIVPVILNGTVASS